MKQTELEENILNSGSGSSSGSSSSSNSPAPPVPINGTIKYRKKNKKAKTKTKTIAIFIVLVIVSAPVIAYLLLTTGKSGLVDVPNLTGMGKRQAIYALASRGLKLGKVEYIGVPNVPAGKVVGQSVDPGEKVIKNQVVGIRISKGDYVFVPDVSGLNVDGAKRDIVEARLMVGSIELVSSQEVEAGFVLFTKPQSGSEVPAGTKITLIVSSGSQKITEINSLAEGNIPKPNFIRPIASLTKVVLTEVNESSLTIRIQLKISNPNPIDVLLKRLSYSVEVEKVPFGRCKFYPNKSISANSVETFSIVLRVPFSGIPPIGKMVLQKGEAKYHLRGYGNVSIMNNEITVPLHIWGKYRFPQVEKMIRYLQKQGKI